MTSTSKDWTLPKWGLVGSIKAMMYDPNFLGFGRCVVLCNTLEERVFSLFPEPIHPVNMEGTCFLHLFEIDIFTILFVVNWYKTSSFTTYKSFRVLHYGFSNCSPSFTSCYSCHNLSVKTNVKKSLQVYIEEHGAVSFQHIMHYVQWSSLEKEKLYTNFTSHNIPKLKGELDKSLPGSKISSCFCCSFVNKQNSAHPFFVPKDSSDGLRGKLIKLSFDVSNYFLHCCRNIYIKGRKKHWKEFTSPPST